MLRGFWPILILMLIIAVLFRDDFIFTLFYLFLASHLIGSFWSRKSLSKVEFVRNMDTHAFLGEKIVVTLQLTNKGLLPMPWLRIHEGLPLELASGDSLQRVITLGPHGHEAIEYQLNPKKRGYYKVGPLYLRTGDLLGMSQEVDSIGSESNLTVYPRIIPLEALSLPSRSPSGTLGHHLPIFEDASRIFGKRDYQPGDSMRRIDWKSTAVSGRLQVKQFEPSIDLNTMVFLDLHASSYPLKTRYMSGELAITVAASVAAWVIKKGQSVGMASNGADDLSSACCSYLASAKGNYQLMGVLEFLARLQLQEETTLVELLEGYRGRLQWGTTLVLITGYIPEAVWQEIIRAQKSGLQVMIYIVGAGEHFPEIKVKAKMLRIDVIRLANELDLQTWQEISRLGKVSYN